MEIQTADTRLPETMQTPVIFTSQNAVRICAQKTKQRGAAICVGARVAQSAKDVGFDVVRTYQTATELRKHDMPAKGTYLRAEDVSVELNKAADLDEFIIYRQSPLPMTPEAVAGIQAGGVVPVYSEYAAERLLNCAGGQTQNATAICISERVAQCLHRSNFAQILTARAPTSEAMLTQLLKLL
jgi:uroporphyrinogen-III synthase